MSTIVAMAERIAELEEKLARKGSSASTSERITKGKEGEGECEFKNVKGCSTIPEQIADLASVGVIAPPSRLREEELDRSAQLYDTTSSVFAPQLVEHTLRSALNHLSHLNQPTFYIPSADLVKVWQDRAIENSAALLQMPASLLHHLLDTHWTWVHTTFLFVPRAFFLRDAALGGEYYSQILLLTVCFHSTRFTERSKSEQMRARLLTMLGWEMQERPSIPFTQALLQLSALEIGKGHTSKAWMYSGMAFRMAIDLGIFADPLEVSSNYLNRDDNDDVLLERRQIRQQLAWSCYLWDKIMSLYLGRMPTFHEVPAWDPPSAPIAQHDQDDLWPQNPSTVLKDVTYGQVFSYTLPCFGNFCKLAIIMNDVLVNIYSKQTIQISSFVHGTQQRLEKWRAETPRTLIIDTATKVCPPPHILVQK